MNPDPDLQRLRYLFAGQAYHQAGDILKSMPEPETAEDKAERRRLRGWVHLALGETEQAYDLFWSCADNPGARAGILALTVLAGQVTAAMTHWQRFCQTLKTPPLALPDAQWHARPVTLAAIAQLQRYPFPQRSAIRGAAALYTALLFRALGEAPKAFVELSKVADYYPAADLVRDRWLEEIVCLPAPLTSQPEIASQPSLSSSRPFSEPVVGPELAVQSAARLLLYPDPDILERQCQEALTNGRLTEAREILDRLLMLDPNHTGALEKRWRLHVQLDWPEAAKSDLFALVDIYERRAEILACQQAAQRMVDLFPDDERALLKMCFLQARLASPLALARYGRQLLNLCREQKMLDRYATYRLWLLRQDLSLDDRFYFELRRL
jgi:tetratricopeptide (TPR) repeat protein